MDSTLKQRLQDDLKESMRSGDGRRKTVVRLLMAGIRNAEVDARTDGRGGVISDDDILALIRREIKQHEESLVEAMNASREDLVREQSGELDILRSYLPAQMSREQVVEQARQVIGELKATSPRQHGEVMKVLLPRLKGKADGRLINEVVRELLK